MWKASKNTAEKRLREHSCVSKRLQQREGSNIKDCGDSMRAVGRPLHSYYSEFGILPIRIGKKMCAKCGECGKLLKNTAEKRLRAHFCVNKRLQQRMDHNVKAVPTLDLIPISESGAPLSSQHHEEENRRDQEETEASQMQQKTPKDYYIKGLSKIVEAKNGPAAENHRSLEYNNEVSYFQHREGTPTRSDNECEYLKSSEEYKVYVSPNSSPVPAENEESKPTMLHMLPGVNPRVEVPNEEDPDMYFLLSLLPHFKNIPEHFKFEAQFDIMAVIKKYKTAGQTESSYHQHQYSLPQCKVSRNIPFHTGSSDMLQTSTHEVSFKEEPVDIPLEI